MKINYSTTALSITNMTLRMFLQGLIPLYPFIIGKITPDSSAVGIFLALSYVFLFFGTYLTGIVVPKYISPKTMLLASVIPIVLALGAFGMITDLWLFNICGCILNVFLGFHICSNIIMMGYYSSEKSVSKNFSVLAVSSVMATVFGGFIVGPMLLWLGYKQAFIAFAVILFLFFLLLLPLSQPVIELKTVVKNKFRISKNLWSLLIFNFLISILLYGFKLSISVMLKRRGWNVGNISVMMALGTSLAVPLTLWWGRVSNYSDSKLLLKICILLSFMAYLSLFWSGNYIFGVIGFGCISVVAYAIAIPFMSVLFGWYDRHSLPRAQSLYNSSIWISAIFSFLFNGYALQHFTETACIIDGLTIAALSLVPLFLVKMQRITQIDQKITEPAIVIE